MPLSDNTRGALMMMASMAAFTLNDTLMKGLAGEVPLFQLLVLRGSLTTIFTGFLAWRMGAMHLRIPARDRGLIALRMVGEIGAAYFFLTALFNMPLANVTAILQSLPLVVTLCAALFFGEQLGWRRMTAILVGLVGVMLIVRPGTEGFNLYSIYALISVAFVVLRDLATRRLSGSTHSMMVTFATTLSVTVFFGAASVTVDWVPLDARSAWMTVGAAAMVMLGYVFSVLVMRIGEISFVAPFRYTGLIWALVLGWYVFGDWPKPLTLIGASIVASSGVLMLLRERQLARRARKKAV
ncbi:DMT family transporter [Thalassobius vesicularis]|uniref:DMT family transporter n=1 Tax=Thalassobius vesicularis TaxID=1294297 RepID=A0A4V3UZC0_9RHOB|nr:DMT family transporter [Thalassobius vesicularis]THD76069.1 DMT family transporter [Thalassobius vesicularis]